MSAADYFYLLFPLTLLTLLPERHHLVEFPLYQPVSLLLIQPLVAGERLLYPREWTVHHHLRKIPFGDILNRGLPDRVHARARPPHLFAVPAGADAVVVVPDGHSAEGTE